MCHDFYIKWILLSCEESCSKEDWSHWAVLDGGGGMKGMKAVIKAFVSSEFLEQH